MRSLKPSLTSIDEKALSKVAPILQDFEEYHNNLGRLLKDIGIPQNLIEQYTMWYPKFSNLLPGEVIDFYLATKEQTIRYLLSKGYSQRKISRILGGTSPASVSRQIKEYDEKDNQD